METGEIPWIYYRNGRRVINGSGKNKGDSGMRGAKDKKKGYAPF